MVIAPEVLGAVAVIVKVALSFCARPLDRVNVQFSNAPAEELGGTPQLTVEALPAPVPGTVVAVAITSPGNWSFTLTLVPETVVPVFLTVSV